MMMKRMITAALAVLVLAAMPGVALAQEATTDEEAPAVVQQRTTTDEDRAAARAEAEAAWLTTVKARALEAIEKRLVTLAELEVKIDGSETLKANHAAALMQDIRFSVKGLEDLAEEIRAATDLETLRVLVPQIFEDYRVYAVVVPKTHLTLGADAAVAIADRLDGATDSIATSWSDCKRPASTWRRPRSCWPRWSASWRWLPPPPGQCRTWCWT